MSRGLAGAVVLAGVHAAVHLLAPHGLGAGDVKLALPLGAVLGAAGSWAALVVATAGAGLLTAVAALLLRRPRLAHGPSMLAAAMVVTAGAAVAAPGGGP